MLTIPIHFTLFFLAAATPATVPAPADPSMDWLMQQAKPASAPQPVTRPSQTQVNPLTAKSQSDGYRQATMTLSDGRQITGRFATTSGQPVRVYDPEKKDYRDVPYVLIRSLEAKVLWERMQEEWHFKDSGSDIREFNGKSYPVHELHYILTLSNGQTVTGVVVTPLYLEHPDGDKLFALHKRDKGQIGQTLKDLVYVKKVEFAD